LRALPVPNLGLWKMRETRRGGSAGAKEWALLAISVMFCLAGSLGLRRDWRMAVVTITFFGACGLVFLANILRRRREQRLRHGTVHVTGNVNIYVDKAGMAYTALACFLLGAVMYFAGAQYPLLFRLIGAFIGVLGIALAIAIATGFNSRQFIRFEPDAFIVGERAYRARIEWTNIASVLTFEYARNPFVGVQLVNVLGVRVEPAEKAGAFVRHVGRNRALMGPDWVIASRNFGIDSVVLANALQRYAMQPGAREELVARNRLSAP
jgi:hypothetical protein